MLNGEKMKKQKWLVLDIRFSFDVGRSMFDVRCSSFQQFIQCKNNSAPVSLPPLPYYLQYKLCAGHHVIKTDTL